MFTLTQFKHDISLYSTGIERVRRGDYAFLMESTMNEYTRQKDCNLMQVQMILALTRYNGLAKKKNTRQSFDI